MSCVHLSVGLEMHVDLVTYRLPQPRLEFTMIEVPCSEGRTLFLTMRRAEVHYIDVMVPVFGYELCVAGHPGKDGV